TAPPPTPHFSAGDTGTAHTPVWTRTQCPTPPYGRGDRETEHPPNPALQCGGHRYGSTQADTQVQGTQVWDTQALRDTQTDQINEKNRPGNTAHPHNCSGSRQPGSHGTKRRKTGIPDRPLPGGNHARPAVPQGTDDARQGTLRDVEERGKIP